ncbi:MAG: TonB-dependent receptor [Janthinobacterium lividum]
MPGAASPPTTQEGTDVNVAVDKIVVTANKRREQARDVANSITALSGQTLDRRQETSVQSLVGEVPGLSVESTDKTSVRIVLRGINAGSAGATVGSILDEVPLNPAGSQNNAVNNTANFDTYDLQRIEVLRGPQGTLYGATAEGGLIKYVTNPPALGQYSAALESGIAGAVGGGLGGTLKGFVNVPVGDKVAVRVTGWNNWIPGYIDNPQLGKSNANSGQQYGYRISVLANPTPDLTIRLTAQRQSLFSNNADYLQITGAAATPNAPPANQLAIPGHLVNNTGITNNGQAETAVYYGTVNYDFGWSNLTSITGFASDKFRNDLDISNNNLAPGLTYGGYLNTVAYGVTPLVAEQTHSNTDKFNQEVRLASEPGSGLFGHRLDWLFGGYYTHETTQLLESVDALQQASPRNVLSPAAGGLALSSSLSEWAFFANADYYITPRIDLALGGRLEGDVQHSQAIDAGDIFFGPSAINPETHQNDHDQLFSVAPRWRVSNDMLLYGRIASGFRPGGPNIPVASAPDLPATFGPDRTVNYEIGWRQDLFDRKVSVDLTGFYITWKDIQILSLVNTLAGPISVNGNAGSAVSKGVEWNISWVPLTNLRLNTVGGYQDARLTTNAPGAGGAAGDYLPYVPSLTASVNVDYGWKVSDRYRAYVSGTYSYIGERYSDFTPAPRVTASHVQLPGYSTGSIRAGIEDDHKGLEFFVNNISNTRGITYYLSDGGANQTGQASIIAPTTIGMLLRVKL